MNELAAQKKALERRVRDKHKLLRGFGAEVKKLVGFSQSLRSMLEQDKARAVPSRAVAAPPAAAH